MNIKYGIMVVLPGKEEGVLDVVHFCGFEEEPTESDYTQLKEELKSDPEFGLSEIVDTLHFMPAPPELIEEVKQTFFNKGGELTEENLTPNEKINWFE